MDMEAVSLAMSNKLTAPSHWLELYSESKSGVTTGAIMSGSAFLILLVPLLISWRVMPWVPFWALFFGWLAAWGILKIAYNAGSMVKAKTMLKGQGYDPTLPAGDQQNLLQHFQPPASSQIPNYRYDTDQLQAPPSVTDRTTKFLDKK